jgi:hypothetical protein
MNKKLLLLGSIAALFLIVLSLNLVSAYNYGYGYAYNNHYQDNYYKDVRKTTSFQNLGYGGYEKRVVLTKTVRQEPYYPRYDYFGYNYRYSGYSPQYHYARSYNYYPTYRYVGATYPYGTGYNHTPYYRY